MSSRYGRYVAALGGLIVLWGSSASTEPRKNHCPNNPTECQIEGRQGEAQPDQRDQTSRPPARIVAHIDGRPEQGPKRDQGDEEVKESWWDRAVDDPGDAFNGVIALVTIILSATGIYQAILSRHTARRQLRAYVFLESGGLYDASVGEPIQGPPLGYIRGEVTIKNSGQTPAYDVLHLAQIDLVTGDGERALALPPLKSAEGNHVPPGGFAYKTVFHATLGVAEMNAVAQGKAALILHGRITYRDAYGENRLTNYRLGCSGRYPPERGEKLTWSLIGGNETDDVPRRRQRNPKA